MNSIRHSRGISLNVVCWLCLAMMMVAFEFDSNSVCAQIPKPTDAPLPLTPSESATTFRMPTGFRMELIAAEPFVQEPTGLCWDERGQLFVSEMHGYNLEGQFDIEELNQTGKLDRVVRRIQASEQHKKAAEKQTYGTIKLLKDVDGDGRIDSSQVWADRLQPCLGICPANGGLIATGQTEIVFLADRDQDGRAEVREVLFSGFGAGALERTINAPQWGLDHWIYVGRGTSGGTIRGPHLQHPVELPNTDFRIEPNGKAIEPVVGATKTIGFAMDLFGDRIVVSTRQPGIYVAPISWKDLARNPYVVTPSLEWSMTNDPVVRPLSQPHPWRIQRADDPGFSKYYSDRYGLAESAPNGYLTSGCSPLIYRDRVLPGLFGQLLCCEPAQNLVFRGIVESKGLRPTIRRSPDDSKHEFLCSTDPWFHAISLAHAPDGTIFVVDFYREIIEDYSAIPRYLQQQYGLMNGADRGRIWRLTHDSVVSNNLSLDFASMGNSQLAQELISNLTWRRDTARRLLVERSANDIAPMIQSQMRRSTEEASVTSCLFTLKSLGQLTAEDVLWASHSPFASVRRAALRFMDDQLLVRVDLRSRALELTNDIAPQVQLQAAILLSGLQEADVIRRVVRKCPDWGNDEWFVSAMTSGAVNSSLVWTKEILKLDPSLKEEGCRKTLAGILMSIGSQRSSADFETIFPLIEAQNHDATIQAFLADHLLIGLRRSRPTTVESQLGMESIARLLQHSDERVQRPMAEIAGQLQWTASPAFQQIIAQSIANASNDLLDEKTRVAAIRLIAFSGRRAHEELLALLDSRQPNSIQLAAIDAIGAGTDNLPFDTLLSKQSTLSSEVQSRIIDLFFTNRDRVFMLLSALEKNLIARNDVPSLRRTQMLEHANREISERAIRIFSSPSDSGRSQVLAAYQSKLDSSGNVERGKTLFEKHCSRCHHLNGIGVEIGPDLDSVRSRPNESLLLDILDPSGSINPKYRTYNVMTKEGRVASGLLADETATSITLVQEKDRKETILRRDIDEMRASTKSIMPEGMEQFMTTSDMNDLLAYLRFQLPSIPNQRVLFDDEAEFLQVLRQGNAEITLSEVDPFSGRASMHLSKGQRHNAAIANWEFNVVEKPKRESEFRYLRFAWKTTGNGIMIELASKGKWPPANRPERRYFSGKNLSAWQATRIDEGVPKEWTVVTVDLWKDFGAFQLTGIAPTCFEKEAWFDKIELLRSLE